MSERGYVVSFTRLIIMIANWKIQLRRVNRNRVLFPLFSLIFLLVVASLISPHFLTTINITNVLSQVSIIAVLTAGVASVILTGGIDLSVGAVLAFGGAITAALMEWYGLPVGIAVLGGIGAGLAAGFANGAMVVWMKIPSFIATLALMAIARGGTLILTGGRPISGFPSLFRGISGRIGGLPVLFLIALGVYVFWHLVLSRTRFGRYIYAVGGNATATHFTGISVRKVRLFAFMFSGFCAALGGVMFVARLNAISPMAGQGYELSAIAAAVLGGVSLSGGYGSLAGAFMGALIMTILRNILNLLRVPPFYQHIATGLILIVAAASLSRGRESAK